jgi:hypothetical protein
LADLRCLALPGWLKIPSGFLLDKQHQQRFGMPVSGCQDSAKSRRAVRTALKISEMPDAGVAARQLRPKALGAQLLRGHERDFID